MYNVIIRYYVDQNRQMQIKSIRNYKLKYKLDQPDLGVS